MLKLTARKFASYSALAATALMSTAADAQTAGITPGDSQPAPRRNNPSTGDSVPELDSRTGVGEFARDVTTRGAAVGDDLHERTTFAGLVTGVSDGRLAVKMAPPRVPTAMEQVFHVSDETPVLVNGEAGTLADITKDSVVRVITYAADPETAAKVIAVSPRSARRPAAGGSEAAEAGRAVPSVAAVTPDGEAGRNLNVYPSDDSQPVPPNGRNVQGPRGGRDAGRPATGCSSR